MNKPMLTFIISVLSGIFAFNSNAQVKISEEKNQNRNTVNEEMIDNSTDAVPGSNVQSYKKEDGAICPTLKNKSALQMWDPNHAGNKNNDDAMKKSEKNGVLFNSQTPKPK